MVVLVSWNTKCPLAHHSSQFGSLKLDEENISVWFMLVWLIKIASNGYEKKNEM
jgi:hypothetical protein